MRATKFSLFLLIVYIVNPAMPIHADFQSEVAAITAPSSDRILSFVQPGRIAEVNIKEGRSVKAGQVLVQQYDAVEQAKAKIAQQVVKIFNEDVQGVVLLAGRRR